MMIATYVIGVFYVASTNLGTVFVVVALMAVIVLVELICSVLIYFGC